MKIFPLFIFFLFTVLSIDAQVFQINGHVIDSSASPLPGAGVAMMNPSDSAIISGASTDADGNFSFINVAAGKVIIKISYLGFSDKFLNKEVVDKNLNLGSIILKEKTSTLGEVNINETVTPVQMKGDTTQYNADAYKINKDANAEDLVTKMPGITTQDGKVQAQGEDVKKILIDGKPYMGDDPNAALKNLPAEVIEKIQVFDKKSDQSEFTGFFDGNTTKTMNIITRPQFRNGTFGRVYGGYGTDDHWKAGTSLNFFKEKRKITLLGSGNDINEQNFSSDDLVGVLSSSGGNRQQGQRGNYPNRGGGGGGGRFQPQNDASNFLVDQRNGITTTQSGGLNYINQFKKTDLSFSYFFNRSDNNTVNNTFRQYITDESSGLTYEELNNGKSINTNHRGNMKLEYKFDSLNSILFQPRLSFQDNTSNPTIIGNNDLNSQPVSHAVTSGNNSLKGISINSPLLYRHSFQKRGRTISLNLTGGYNENTGDGDLRSVVEYSTDTVPTDSTDQLTTQDTHSWNYSSEIVYTEPLDSNKQLSFTYKGSYTLSESDKRTTSVYNVYGEIDTALSNNFNSDYLAHSFGVNYRINYEKWNGMLGVSAQRADLNNERIFPDENKLERQFNSILPAAFMQYRFTARKNLRIFLRSVNNPPSVTQLQNVVNNSNPLQLTTGNPELQQDWQNSINVRYSSSNSEKNTSFFIFFNGSFTEDYVANSTFIATTDTTSNGITLTQGAQISRPVNLDGYYSLRSFGNYSLPMKFIKSSLNLNANANYTRTPGLLNDQLTYSTSTATGLGFAVSSNISEKVDFVVSSNANFSNVKTTSETNSDNNSFNLSSRAKIQVMPWKGLVLQTDLNHQYNSGLSENFNQNYVLWNAAIGYKFLKDRLAELRLSVFDILEQNASVSRNTTDIYYEDVRSNVLQQYFMLTFTYNLKFFKAKKEGN